MKAHSKLVAVFLVVGLMTTAWAEVTVSITLSGPIDELLPILEHLREMGVGAGQPAEQDGLKLELQSVATTDATVPGAETTPPPEPAPPEPPVPSLAEFAAIPAQVEVGGAVFLSVVVSSGAGIVDTLSATLEGSQEHIELYDNGEHGDPVAGDGQWSAEIRLDPQLSPGPHPLTITAYNANGAPVTVKGSDGQLVNLTAQVALDIKP